MTIMEVEENTGFSEFERDLLKKSIAEYLQENWEISASTDSAEYLSCCEEVWDWLINMEYISLSGKDSGTGLTEVAAVTTELGKVSCRIPFASTVFVRSLMTELSGGNSGELAEIIGQIQCGLTRYTLSLGKFDGDIAGGSLAEKNGKLNGSLRHVEWSPITNCIAVVTDNKKLALVEAGSKGVTVRGVPGLARPSLVDIEFNDTEATTLSLSDDQIALLSCKLRLGLMSRTLGSIEKALDLVVSYAKDRYQFGKPIGSFQAIQHKLVNCLISLEGSRLLFDQAAQSLDRRSKSFNFYLEAAFAYSGANLRQTILEVHHAFGAVGFSEEHELPTHFRQVHSDLVRCGGFTRARAELAAMMLSEERGGRLPESELGEKAEGFRQEVRQWLKEYWHEGREKEHCSMPFGQRGYDSKFSKAVGEQGWIAASWPKEYGGQERSPIEHYVLIEEMDYAGAPFFAHVTGGELVGPALLAFGTEEQKQDFLPAFQRGEREFCLGYSEPGSGSDLASLKTKAVKDGDDWVINGQKIWTTRGAESDYIWLAVKTDTAAVPPHAGISMFMVPLNTKGITIRPSMALYGHTFCNIFFDDVRVPSDCLVGQVNEGWKVITQALSAERVLMGGTVGRIRRLLERAIMELQKTPIYSGLANSSLTRDRIGELVADLAVARLFALRSVSTQARGVISPHEASVTKIFSAELMEKMSERFIDIFGVSATYEEGCPDTPLNGFIEQTLRRSIMMVVGGGTAEIQRNQIAIHGLGLPRK